jgi:excinuclease ABC subunit B
MAHLSNLDGKEIAGKLPEVRLANTPFHAVAPYEPAGDQPQAIEQLAQGVEDGLRYQTLLGVTGSGKTFTMAKVIEAVQKPTLVLAPNKTLAAQLAGELKEFFPDNAVVYFVSYYDYYQPEAYVPSSDTFIEKDASINEEVEKLRHAATSALLSRRDCIVVASVSCIYGIGSPADYAGMAVFLDKEKEADRDDVIHDLIDIQYDRNDYELKRGTFRVRGDALEVFPPYADNPIRVEFWGDEIEDISEVDRVTGEVLGSYEALPIWPASHYVTARPKMEHAIKTIQDELRERLQQFRDEGKLLEAERLEMRTNYDLEMLETMGFCSGIENYSRHLDGTRAGRAPVHADRLLPARFPVHHRREPRDGAADPRHARGRPQPQGDARGPRIPPAQLPGQPPAAVRRVRGARAAVHLRVRHAGRLRGRGQPEARGADHPPDRPARPRDHRAAGGVADRRHHRRGARAGGAQRACAHHDAD